jgi:IS30 family transposase
VGPPGPKGQGRNKPHRGDRRWVQAWSPEQIAKRLPLDFPDDGTMRISHEAIYQALYVQSRGGLQRELVACLRTGRALRVPRSRARQKVWAHVTPEVMISERPAKGTDCYARRSPMTSTVIAATALASALSICRVTQPKRDHMRRCLREGLPWNGGVRHRVRLRRHAGKRGS